MKPQKLKVYVGIVCYSVHFATFKNANDAAMKQLSSLDSKCRLDWDWMTFKKVL